MAKKKGSRIQVILECTEHKESGQGGLGGIDRGHKPELRPAQPAEIPADGLPQLDQGFGGDGHLRQPILDQEKGANINQQTKQENQLIGITGISDHFKKIFGMVGITKFAKIYDTVEEALEMMA